MFCRPRKFSEPQRLRGESLEAAFADFAVEVGLEVVAGLDMEPGEPSAASDVGVDADGVAEVAGLMGFLSGVAADHGFARAMRSRWSVEGMIELLMNQGVGDLLVGGHVGFEVGVDEDVTVGFDEGLIAEEEGPVFFRDIVHAVGSIRIECFLPSPDCDPMGEVGVVDARENELLLMIPAEKVDLEVLLLLNKEVDDLFGMSSPVHVITYENNMIFRLGIERFPESEKRFEATVNVTDGKCSHKKNLLAQRGGL